MTEKALEEIVTQAKSRWDIFDALIIHRVGTLHPQDQIVLVVTLGAHRGEAFAACEFIMDFLKTQAPFWKKEVTPQGERWVEARASDDDAAARWQAPGEALLTPPAPAAVSPADAPKAGGALPATPRFSHNTDA
jgi:molybdopterin synthase catalytic subunit